MTIQTTNKIETAEVWTEHRCDSELIDWTLRIDGKQYAGGCVNSHVEGYAAAADIMRVYDPDVPPIPGSAGTLTIAIPNNLRDAVEEARPSIVDAELWIHNAIVLKLQANGVNPWKTA